VVDGHHLTITRQPNGMNRWGHPRCATHGRCECGWAHTSAQHPTKGGVRDVRTAHLEHTHPTGGFNSWLRDGIRNGWVTPMVDRTCDELAMRIVVTPPARESP
jgi:hypothetical protein